MTLTLRCQTCRSFNLEIQSGTDGHYADLRCQSCDPCGICEAARLVGHLSSYQAKSFGRHLPQSASAQQFSVLAGGEP